MHTVTCGGCLYYRQLEEWAKGEGIGQCVRYSPLPWMMARPLSP